LIKLGRLCYHHHIRIALVETLTLALTQQGKEEYKPREKAHSLSCHGSRFKFKDGSSSLSPFSEATIRATKKQKDGSSSLSPFEATIRATKKQKDQKISFDFR
jgi:hypothetical protein